MDLSRAVAKFAKNEIMGWNSARKCFEPTGKKGTFLVYDRFISDRTFGTKKRLLLLPRQDYIPDSCEYVRVGNSIARFMVDSLNEDAYADTPYANTYLVREAKYRVEICIKQGEVRASGVGGRKDLVVIQELFGDYERYTANNSGEFDTVDYTVCDIFLPLSTEVDSTMYIRIDGKVFEVTDVARVSNLLWVRGQKLAKDVPVVVKTHALYECDLVTRWETIDYEVDGGQQLSVTFERPCHTRMISISSPIEEFCGCVSSGAHCYFSLFDPEKNLLASSDENGKLEYQGSVPAGSFLAVVPMHFQDSGSALVALAISPTVGGYGELYDQYYGFTSIDECQCP